MAPSLVSLGAVALAYSSGVAALLTYQVTETYDYTNFFDKFDFFVSNYSSPNYNDVDPTSGYVNYRSQADAVGLGLIAVQGYEAFIGVNHADSFNPMGVGRDSIRIESKSSYNKGLIITTFTHLPAPACGLWPGL